LNDGIASTIDDRYVAVRGYRSGDQDCILKADDNRFAKQQGEPALTNAKNEAEELLKIF
jgi:hypothetical protein